MTTRLASALDSGALALPADGRLLALRLPAACAPELPAARTDVAHGFAPEAALWTRAGFTVTPEPPPGPFAAVLLAAPRARDHALCLLRQAFDRLSPGGLLLLDGQKTDGIEPLLKLLRSELGPMEVKVEVEARAHGKLLWLTRPERLPPVFADGPRPGPAPGPQGWTTAPGVFSAQAVDPGSALLVANLPVLKGRVCDLGAGWGVLSRAILERPEVTALDLVEAEWDALAAARLNIADPRAGFVWADAREHAAPRYDAIVANPPFHAGRAADPALGQAFLGAASGLLARAGVFALVANRHLPYERALTALFGRVETVAEQDGFKVIHARQPKSRA